MASLMDILEPLSSTDASVMLYIGMLSTAYREGAEDFWALRHAAYLRGDFERGRAVTRLKAAAIAGVKRKRCHGCGENLALPWPFEPSICICSRCTKRGGVPKFRLISATDAMNHFKLDLTELWTVDQFHTSGHFTQEGEPYLASRSMFLKDDVIVLAMDKHG